MDLILPPNHILTTPVSLIGICGHAGSGKDTAASMIQDQLTDTWVESFADPLKEAAAAAFGISLDDFYLPEKKEIPHPFWGGTPRMIAQFFGTELFREHIWKLIPQDSQDFWIRRMVARIDHGVDDVEYSGDDTVIIPDVRFQNEYEFILGNKGIIIHLTRQGANGTVGIPSHHSEKGINFNYPERTFYVENNGSLDEQAEKLTTIYN